MKLHEVLAPARLTRHRVGRGISAGGGKTAGRGTKGQKSRSGYKLPRRFEGGQSSFIQRLPKRRGFRSPYAKALTVRISDVLERIPEGKITKKALVEVGLIHPSEMSIFAIKIVGVATNLRPLKWDRDIRFSKQLAKQLESQKKS